MSSTPLKPEFIASLEGITTFNGLPEALTGTAPVVSVRLNPHKGSLPADADTDGNVPWCPGGTYLASRPTFTFDPAMHQGRYYVQDASSMILYPIVRELAYRLGDRPLTLLDSCAAPGGKTLCALDALPEGSVVIANEYDYRRAEILKENVIKWASPNTVIVSRGDTARFRRLRSLFDIVIVDAPCSGEGMMRKDDTARQQWSPTLVTDCATRQYEILDNVWASLRPGGYLIYSTCTFNLTENEELLKTFMADNDATSVPLSIGARIPGVTGSLSDAVYALRFIPGKTRGEGLFVAVIQKPGSQAGTPNDAAAKKNRKTAKSHPIPESQRLLRWLDRDDITLIQRTDTIYAIPQALKAMYQQLDRELDIIHAGTEIATIKGRDLIPAHSLALSPMLANDAFTRVEIDLDTALRYLRKDAITLPDLTATGYILLTFGNIPLGFVKNLGNRTNNLYPSNWRIISAVPRP